MNNFTHDEMNLLCIYNSDTRLGCIDALINMRGYIAADEAELQALTDSALRKLNAMSNEDYAALELFPDFDE